MNENRTVSQIATRSAIFAGSVAIAAIVAHHTPWAAHWKTVLSFAIETVRFFLFLFVLVSLSRLIVILERIDIALTNRPDPTKMEIRIVGPDDDEPWKDSIRSDD